MSKQSKKSIAPTEAAEPILLVPVTVVSALTFYSCKNGNFESQVSIYAREVYEELK